MRIKTKGRHGLAVLIYLASQPNTLVSLSTIATNLNVSKLYLEQVLVMLKAAKWVESIKGPTGGYRYHGGSTLSAYEVLHLLEPDLTDAHDPSNLPIDHLLNQSLYQPLDEAIEHALKSVTIVSLANTLNSPMYFI